MEFIASKADLLRELGLGQRLVERKNTIPILSNILIETDDDGLTLPATDLEVGLRSHCPAKVEQPGSVTVSAKKLFEIVRALPDEDVRIASSDSLGITITAGRAKFKLVGLDSKDFPNLPECSFESAWKTSTGLLRRLLGKVLFAVSSDESRFPLSGVLLLGSAKSLSLVATDGHRLSVAEASEGLQGLTGEARLLIPKKALVEVKQIADLGDESIECEVKENHVYFRIGRRTLVARMIEDQFPQYEKVIPQNNDKCVLVSRIELDGAARRAALLSNEKGRAVKFAFESGALTLSASNPDMGEVREQIPIDYDAEEFDIAFNAQYLLDFLAVTQTEQVELHLKDGSTQTLVKPAAGEETGQDVDHFCVIMPMRL